MGLLSVALSPMISEVKSWNVRCANDACEASSLLRAVSRRKSGIRVGESWYCGPKCFEAAAQLEFMRILCTSAPHSSRPRARMPLGLVLLSRGQITQEQFNVALDMSKSTKMKMGEVLQQLGFATEEQVTSAMAAQWGYPVFPLNNRSPFVPVRIPRVLLELYNMTPVHYVEAGRKLVLGFVERIDNSVTYVIERMTGCAAIPCFITPNDYRRQFAAVPPGEGAENEVIFDRTTHPVEMARITTSYALQIGAEEARFGQCSSYGWVRLKGQRQDVDLLFQLRTA